MLKGEAFLYFNSKYRPCASFNETLTVLEQHNGIPESDLHWFVTYHSHHNSELGMNPSKVEECVLSERKYCVLCGMTAHQVDDLFGFGHKNFLADEESAMKRFKCKPRKIFVTNEKQTFNGVEITVKSHGTMTIK